jgi:serine/threonine protein phosphatase PrpC
MLTEDEIVKGLCLNCTLGEKADYLYWIAMQKGGRDNISVVLVEAVA